jgi:C1A family cysteine protease
LLQHLKHCLADGFPFVFGFMTYESFDHHNGKWKNGVMPIPNRKTEKKKGGHAVMAVGYDDKLRAFLVRNSWGPKWGHGGDFLMPYQLMTDPKVTHDFWTIRGVTS